jgi:seryl-tRNA synthetase
MITNETAVLSNQYLTPAACLHIYPMLEGEQIETKIVTTKAQVYLIFT